MKHYKITQDKWHFNVNMVLLFTNQIYRHCRDAGRLRAIMRRVSETFHQPWQTHRESTNRRAKITASAGGADRKQTKGGEERREGSRQGNHSVVIHFEDTAFDDAHVSVPHNLMSAMQEKETQINSIMSVNGSCNTLEKLQLWDLCEESKCGDLCTLNVYVSFYEYLFVKHVEVQGCVNP